MRPGAVFGKCLLGSLVISILFFLSTATASLVTFPGGKIVDLGQEQLDQIKAQPGVFFVRYPKDKLIAGKITNSAIVEIPEDLGGGFLVGLEKNIKDALAAVMARDPGVRIVKPGAPSPKEDARGESSGWLRTAFMLATDHRLDKLDWNIAGDISGHNPNILSELTWNNLKIFQLRLANETVIHEVVYARWLISYGWIYGGDNQDSDYLEDNRNLEFSRSTNSADDGHTLDWSIGIGPRFTFGGNRFEIMPLVGYSFHEQHLTMSDGLQTIPPLGPFSGLASTYDTEWRGPWVGVDFKLTSRRPIGVFKHAGFYTSFEYHLGDYYAEANWNLRTTFAHPKSFEQEADGQGYVFSIGTKLYFNPHWALTVGYVFTRWDTDPGVDRTFFATGQVSETRLNEVHWTSHTLALAVCYSF